MELFKKQKFSRLRKHHRELGVPWTDPTFPPSDTSIGHSKMKQLPRDIQWKRPHVRKHYLYITRMGEPRYIFAVNEPLHTITDICKFVTCKNLINSLIRKVLETLPIFDRRRNVLQIFTDNRI